MVKTIVELEQRIRKKWDSRLWRFYGEEYVVAGYPVPLDIVPGSLTPISVSYAGYKDIKAIITNLNPNNATHTTPYNKYFEGIETDSGIVKDISRGRLIELDFRGHPEVKKVDNTWLIYQKKTGLIYRSIAESYVRSGSDLCMIYAIQIESEEYRIWATN